jgi:hypothetical protein
MGKTPPPSTGVYRKLAPKGVGKRSPEKLAAIMREQAATRERRAKIMARVREHRLAVDTIIHGAKKAREMLDARIAEIVGTKPGKRRGRQPAALPSLEDIAAMELAKNKKATEPELDGDVEIEEPEGSDD